MGCRILFLLCIMVKVRLLTQLYRTDSGGSTWWPTRPRWWRRLSEETTTTPSVATRTSVLAPGWPLCVCTVLVKTEVCCCLRPPFPITGFQTQRTSTSSRRSRTTRVMDLIRNPTRNGVSTDVRCQSDWGTRSVVYNPVKIYLSFFRYYI